MLKSKKARDAARRFAAITMAFLMVFQYTASGLSVYSWAEDGSEQTVEEAVEKKTEKEEAPGEGSVKPSQEDASDAEDKPEPEAKQEEPEKEEAPAAQDQKEEEPVQKDEGKVPENQDAPQEAADEQPGNEDSEDEIQYPAQSFVSTVSGVTVRIQAPEGALPEGSNVTITPVKASTVQKTIQETTGDEVKVIKAMDITFVDKDGNEIEPEQKVQVNFEYEKFGKVENAGVYHVDDKGQAERLDDKKVGVYNDQVSISTKDFSVYAVVEQEQVHVDSRLLVKFVKPDGTLIDSMYVKKDDNMEQVLYDPGVGTLDTGVYFKGWTTNEDYDSSTTPMTIADVRDAAVSQLDAGIPEGEEITYYAMLFKDYRITYFDENDISLGQEEVAFRSDSATNEQSYRVNMAYTVQDDTHNFEGWNVKEGGSNIAGHTQGAVYHNNDTITITGDVKFAVNAPEGHWFIFDENGKGATYNAPQFIYSSEKPTRPDDNRMIRNGYTFGGWFADKSVADQTSGGTQYNFDQTLTDKTTVYARWVPKTTAGYTIIIWKQNLDGDGWDFERSITDSGTVGNNITGVSQHGTGNNAYASINGTNYQYAGFHLKEFDQNVRITTEGNAVLNVYYERNQHTLTFRDGTGTVTFVRNNGNSQTNTIGDQITTNINDYENNKRIISGYEISSRRGWFTTTYAIKINGNWYEITGNNADRILNARSITSVSNGTVKTITALYGQSIGDNFPIEGDNGVTYDNGERWMPQNSSTYTQVIVYIDIMPDEDITFNLNTASHSTKHIYYYVEALPGETGETVSYNGKTFVLYKDIAANYGYFTEAEDYIDLVGFDKFGYTPNNAWGSGGASTVYCYYTRNNYTINFMDGKYVDGDENPLSEPGMGQIDTEEGISYGADVSSHNSYKPDAAHTPSGYVFEGWYIDSECSQPYSFTTMPEGGITVYAKWRQKQYRVFLHPNYPAGATDNIDWGTANQALNFRISEGGHVSEPTGLLTGFEFVGWYLDEACTHVFNGDAYPINETNVTDDYDKAVDMTDTYDNNGNLIDPKSNSDATGYNGGDRFWITKKLDVYAKWRTTLEGASGIVVEYDANGGTGAPTDTNTYVDGARAPAGPASRSTEPDKQFGYWEVQKWNGSGWESTGTKVFPGGTFLVLAENAKVEDIEHPVSGGDTKKYTVRLKAVYIDTEKPTPTHIYWYQNTGVDAFRKDVDLEINAGVDIPAAPERDGYKFLGWARIGVGDTLDAATAWEADNANWTQDLDADDVYIQYTGSGYETKDDHRTVTQVAADEDTPYHAMFAVWQEKLEIKITGETATKKYNGDEQSVTGHKVEYKRGTDTDWSTTAPAGVRVDLKTAGSDTAKGTEVGEYPMGLSVDKFNIDPGSYAFDPSEDLEIIDGKLTITEESIKIKITGNTDSKTYNGSEQSVTGFTVEYKVGDEGEWTETVPAGVSVALKSGETAEAARTNVGTTDMELTAAIFDITTTNYAFDASEDLEIVDGHMTITPVEVTITAKGDSKTYDGSELKQPGFTVIGLPEGDDHTFTVVMTADSTITNAGTQPNKIATVDGTAVTAGTPVTIGNYTVTTVSGTLTINKKAITVTTGSAEKEYDGKALTEPTVIVTGLVTGQSVTALATGSQIEVGSSNNTYSITWDNANQNNYEITDDLGTLTVTKTNVAVIITAPSDSKTYDGTALTCDGTGEKKVTASGLPEGFTVEATASGSQTDAGESANVVNDGYIIKNAAGEDKTANFTNVKKVGGTLTVNKAPVTITTGTASKPYDGTPLTKAEASIEGLVNGETATVTATGSQTEVGSSSNTYSIEWGTTNKDNYTITENLGTLTVTESSVEVVLTAASDSKTYDGTALTNAGVTASGLPEGFTVEATASGSQTDAGSSANVVNNGYVIKNAAGEDKTANFTNVKKVDGTLTVNKAPVTITTGSASKAYDGTALTKAEASITGLVNNETATVTATGSQTEVGSSSNTYSIDWGTAKANNYQITENLGTLTITENNAEVTLTAPSDSKTYDGTALTCDGTGEKKVTASGLPEGFTVEATARGSQTDAGSSANVVNDGYVIKNAAGEDKTANFTNVKKVDGTLTVNKAPVTITTGTASKPYDGTPLTKAEASIEGLVNGETATVTATGSQTEVGSSSNTYSIDWGTAKADNYTITENLGTLTITENAAEVTLTAASDSKTYDGTALTNAGVTASGLPEGFTVEATASGSQTDVGESTNVVNDGYVIKNATGEDKTANFTNVKKVSGTLEVKPLAVTVTIRGSNSTDPYDGTAHTVTGYDVEISNELYTEADFTFSGTASATRTDVVEGEDEDGQTDMGLAADQFKNNNNNFTVTFEVTDGYQKITPITAEVTIEGHNSTLPYDGQEHTVTGYEFAAANELYDLGDFVFSGTASATRKDIGTTNMGLAASQFTNVNPNFSTVIFKVTDGYQTITPIDVTVTIVGNNNTTDYDGEEHTVTGYTATANSDLYDVTKDFTFSGTANATRTDAGTTNMGLAANQFTNTNPNFGTVTFNVTDGYQTITPIDVTVTIVGNNNTANYDGEEHTVTGYTATADSDLYDVTKDFTFSGTAEAARTNAGTTNMGLAADQFTNKNENFATVTFNVTDGYQTIDPIDVTVTITGHNNTTTYDGNEHSVSGYDVEISNELYTESDFTFSGTAAAARTDAGTTDMGLAAEQFANTNENFATVTFNVTDGYQTITPVDEIVVTITGHNNTANYDGEEHSVSGYDVEISNELYTEADFTFSGTAEAARTDAGTTNMGLTAGQFANKNENFAKVTFNVTDGYQTIDPINVTVTITGHNNTADYDGEEHSVSGYDVEISNDLYKESDFTFSGTAEAARTDAGTTNMGLAAEQFTNNNENFATVTFNVTDGYQTIDPINVTVTIVGANNTTDYDGNEHSVSGYTATADSDLYDVTKDFTFSGTAEAARTDVGTTNMGLKAEQFTNTNPNFGTVTFNVTDGYQTITPIDVTVTIVGANNTTDYDGNEHSVSGYTATADIDLYDVTKDFTFSGTAEAARTDVGATNMGLAADQFTNTNTNFANVTFEVTDGYQAIRPIDITVIIVGANNTTDYDGEEHSVSGYTATADSDLYDVTKDFTFSGTAEAARTDVGTTNMGLKAEQFTNTNPNFGTVTFNVTDGYQTIDPIDVTVTITGHNNTTTYDGEEHSISGYDVEISNELYRESDFTFSGTAEAARTDVGTTNMGLAAEQFTNKNENFATVTFNVTDGYQTITEKGEVVVTITGHHNTTNYDGREHSVSGYDVEISDPLYKVSDFTFSGTAEAARTDAGTTNMGLAADQFTNNNNNFKDVTFNVTDGYQTIDPINVTVTIIGANNTTDYDGEEHSVSGYTATASSDLYDVENDFTFSGTAEAARTDAGTTNMGLAADQFTNTNPNFGTVTFNVTDGYQTISPIDVTVTIIGANNTTDYDGEEHSVSGYTATASSDLYDVENDFTFSGAAEAARTDAGTTNMGLVADQFTNTNPNFGTVTFNVTDGYQTIDPIDVTVTIIGANNTTDYDGEEHTVTGYTATADSDLYDVDNDFTFSGTASATRTDAGTTNMSLAADQFTNTNTNFANVTFEVTDGYQKIDPIDVTVTITEHSDEVDYDGEEHTVTGYDVEISNPLYKEADFTFNGNASVSGTNAGSYDMELKPEDFTNTNDNFANVTFNIVEGQLVIKPINVTVTITGHNNTTTYDGDEHSVSGYDVEISNPLYKEADFTFDGTAEAARTDVGTTNMGLAAEQFTNKNENFATVTFNVTDGYQTITEKGEVVVTITGHINTTDYDGEEHSVSGYDVEISDPLYKESDFTFSGTAEAARTDAGTTNMGLAADQFTNNNNNFKDVTFNVTDGYQTINPINVTVTITEHSDEVDYDGEEHTVTGYDVSISNPLYTENDFTFSGNASVSGTNAGSYDMELKPEDFTNTSDNFATVTFVIVDGQLVIDPIDVTVTITEHSDEVDYDGKEHTVSGYDVSISNPLYTEDDFTFSGNDSVSGTNAGSYDMDLKPGDFTNTNDNFANVTFVIVDGQLVIDPIDVTVTIVGSSNTADYDGEAHTVEGYTATANSDLYDVDNDFVFSGTASATRTDAGTTNMGLAADQFENTNTNFANVTFEVTDGYQKIDPLAVTVKITGNTGSKPYNGEEQKIEGYAVEISDPLYKESDFTFSGEAVAKGTEIGKYPMELTEDQFTNNNSNFNVTFEVTSGELEITKAVVTVTITGNSDSVTYDGNEHQVSGYTVKISDPLYKESDFTFSGSASANGTDAGTYPMGLSASQFKNNNDSFDVVFNVTDGDLTISRKKVTVSIVGHTDTVTYDGEEHTVEGYDIILPDGEKLAEGDITYDGTAAATGKDKGTYPMDLDPEKFHSRNGNYDITFDVTDGSLVIDPAEVMIIADDKDVIYGDELPELTATVTGTIGADTIDYSLRILDPDNRLKNAGTYTIEVVLGGQEQQLSLNAEGEQGNYTITTRDGTLTIEKHKLVIKTDSGSKKYDGKALKEPGVKVSGLQYNEKIKVTATGSQTKVGSSDNTYSIDWLETDKNNYEIENDLGTLKVTSTSTPADDDDEDDVDETEEEKEQKKSTPIKTGDENVLEGWIALMLLAGTGIVFIEKKRRREE